MPFPHLRRRPPLTTFRLHGAQGKAGCLTVIGGLVLATLSTLAGFALMGQGGLLAWASIPVSFALLFGGFFGLLHARRAGFGAPYLITLDTTAGTWTCDKRGSGVRLWTATFYPDRLYLAPLKMRPGDARRPPWTLAYSEHPHAPVDMADPTSEHMILAEGDKDALYALAEALQNENPALPLADSAARTTSTTTPTDALPPS